MKTVTKTALANVKQNKGRNFLCGCAIALTTFLIFVVLTVGYGMIRVQLASVDAYYPTYHIMFRQVSEKNTKALQVHNDIEEIGLRMDLGQIIDDDATIIMTAMDNNGIRLNKAELEEGTFPKNEKDIVVSKGVLEELGIQGKLGDEITIPYQIYEKDGMGYAKEDTFRICGFMESSDLNKEKKMYFVMNSMEYAKQMIPEADREYRVMFRLADAEHMTTDEIEERGKEIGEDFGVPEGNVVENREYLVANYTDPSFVKGMIVVIVMVVLAGILTIYSIYYVSMIPKVQEYGKLKAIGSTKRQIRQMVFREGMLVTALALPVGLLISSFLSRWIMKQMITFMAGEDPLMQVAAELVKNGEVSLLHWWIYAITIMAVLFTSAVSRQFISHINCFSRNISVPSFKRAVTVFIRCTDHSTCKSVNFLCISKQGIKNNITYHRNIYYHPHCFRPKIIHICNKRNSFLLCIFCRRQCYVIRWNLSI